MDGTRTAPEVVWYFDLVSPFARLALPAVLALAGRRPVALRPVLLGPLLAHWGQVAPADIPPKRVQIYRLARFRAERAGLGLTFPPRHPFRSLEAMRLLTALDGQAQAVRGAFDFIWGEGRDPSDPAELASLGLRLGVADVPATIGAAAVKDRLRSNTDAAAAAGVFGVPTLAVGGELFWGEDAMPMAEAFLEDPEMLSRGEMARLAELPYGLARKAGS